MHNTREKLIKLMELAYYCSIEEMADYLIANGVTFDNRVSKWISVKDRLPEPFVDVIAFFGGQEMYVDCVDNKGRWYSSYMYICVPTYWMPLPQPPKGE